MGEEWRYGRGMGEWDGMGWDERLERGGVRQRDVTIDTVEVELCGFRTEKGLVRSNQLETLRREGQPFEGEE